MRETDCSQEKSFSATEVLEFFSFIVDNNSPQPMEATITSQEGRIEASITPRTEGSLQRTPPPNPENN
jgi:hypothetical protein